MDILPFWMQLSFAVALWVGALVAAAAGILWVIKWVRNYRDEKKSALNTQ